MKKKKRKRRKHPETISREDHARAIAAVGRTPFSTRLYGKRKKRIDDVINYSALEEI